MRTNEPQYLTYLFTKAKQNSIPLSGTFELTGRCNFNCKMCYVHHSDNEEMRKKELTTKQWLSIADEAQKAGVLMLLITGGEPLLRDDFDEIYIHCKNLGFEIAINTNGSLITDDKIKLFMEYPPTKLNISLYGASESTYENVTCRKGYFEKVTENIKKLKAAGIKVKINVTTSEFNQDEIPQIYELIQNEELPFETSCYLFPSPRLGKETPRPTSSGAARNMIRCEKCFMKPDNFKKKAETLEQIQTSKTESTEIGEHIPCRAGLAAFWITYEGKMIPCGMMTTPCASVIEKGVSEAWKEINSASKEITLPPECKSCPYKLICESCAASCYAETGAFNIKPEYICRKTHEYVRLIKEEGKNEI